MAEWVETNVNGYNVYAYDGNDWAAVNKTYAYWDDAPTENDWYVYTDSTDTVIMGLTVKLANPSDPTSAVFDSTYGWGQSSYIIPNSVVDIDKAAFVNYYDKGGTTAITGLPLAPPTQQCELYLHDGMSFSRTGSDSLFSGYSPLNKIRFPNNFTGLNNDGNAFALFSANPQNIALSTLAELVIPPNFVAITSNNFGSNSFSREFFPSFKRLKIMRSTSTSALNFVNLSLWGTAMWNWSLGNLGSADAIATDFEIYLDFDESELPSKINFNTAAPDTDLTTFKGVFNYLKSDGRVYFNQTITND